MQEKGAISGRLFEPSKAGGKILKLSYREVIKVIADLVAISDLVGCVP